MTYKKIEIVDKEGTLYVLQNPHGFGMNEFQFFCTENDDELVLIPTNNVSSVVLFKSKILKVS